MFILPRSDKSDIEKALKELSKKLASLEKEKNHAFVHLHNMALKLNKLNKNKNKKTEINENIKLLRQKVQEAEDNGKFLEATVKKLKEAFKQYQDQLAKNEKKKNISDKEKELPKLKKIIDEANKSNQIEVMRIGEQTSSLLDFDKLGFVNKNVDSLFQAKLKLLKQQLDQAKKQREINRLFQLLIKLQQNVIKKPLSKQQMNQDTQNNPLDNFSPDPQLWSPTILDAYEQEINSLFEFLNEMKNQKKMEKNFSRLKEFEVLINKLQVEYDEKRLFLEDVKFNLKKFGKLSIDHWNHLEKYNKMNLNN